MRILKITALALTLLAATPFRADSGEWRIDDAPVPMDETTITYSMILSVPDATTCSMELRSQYITVEPLWKDHAAFATLWVGGVPSMGMCTVDGLVFDDTCVAINQLIFEAEGDYEVSLVVRAVPFDGLGGNWDDFGAGQPHPDPENLISPLHHNSVLHQDCGELTDIELYVPPAVEE